MKNFDFSSYVEKSQPCYIIAEIGVNHSGDVDLAKKMVDAAKDSGADAVKFQTFTASSLVSHETPKVTYQKRTTSDKESHYEMIRKLEFSRKGHEKIKDYCDNIQINFISTPYDVNSAIFLNELGVSLFKTASADLVDLPLHEYLAKTGKGVIIATGMATLGEIERTVEIYRNCAPYQKPKIALLHCVSNYPCKKSSLNLRVIPSLQAAFQTDVGFSDHSKGNLAAVVSVALGARIIEKHFTLDKSMQGPDHMASSTPQEFADLVRSIRETEMALGTHVKSCQDEERSMALVSRKSIVAAKDIKKGSILSLNDIALKRPGTGLGAFEIDNIIGKKARFNLYKDDLLSWGALED